MRQKLEHVREWAHDGLQAGEVSVRTWYRYMKLVETIDQITAEMDARSAATAQRQRDLGWRCELRITDSHQP
ncbi:MAG: hypothetical protein NTV51_03870 [Verrucomicrobia bacterium]|nr:hypothetical protein [Verrucomicrobiota bacterium]